MNGIEVTYVCGKTGKQAVSAEGLPDGWVVPTLDVSSDVAKDPPPHHTVIAFSSEEAQRKYVEDRIRERTMNL
jgi:hypothetical protein